MTGKPFELIRDPVDHGIMQLIQVKDCVDFMPWPSFVCFGWTAALVFEGLGFTLPKQGERCFHGHCLAPFRAALDWVPRQPGKGVPVFAPSG